MEEASGVTEEEESEWLTSGTAHEPGAAVDPDDRATLDRMSSPTTRGEPRRARGLQSPRSEE